MGAPTVVFDLDGTLIDTAPDLVATLNVILTGAGFAAVDYGEARNMVGAGARAMIVRGLAFQGQRLADADVDRLCERFIAYYADHIADRSVPFAGVEPALDELALSGCRLAICTNKLEWLSVKLLNALGLTHRFAAICGGDTFGVSKPDPAILRGTVARAGGRASEAVMVGDAATDVAAARAANIPVIAVDFGYSATPIAALAPDRVVSDFAAVPEAVRALAGAPQNASRPTKLTRN
jgi:phosphoglycolate phosphatase